jgi:hypothetical protein
MAARRKRGFDMGAGAGQHRRALHCPRGFFSTTNAAIAKRKIRNRESKTRNRGWRLCLLLPDSGKIYFYRPAVDVPRLSTEDHPP